MKFVVLAVAALAAATSAVAAERQGPWIEARAGWDHFPGDGGSSSGLVYGGSAGYDFALGGRGFFGVQAGIAGSTIEECEGGICANAGRDIELLARAGFGVAERTSLYALGGYSNARFSGSGAGISVGDNVDGFRLGAGIEQGFGSNLFSKLEYRYTNYGTANIGGFEEDAGNRHQVSASFGIRF